MVKGLNNIKYNKNFSNKHEKQTSKKNQICKTFKPHPLTGLTAHRRKREPVTWSFQALKTIEAWRLEQHNFETSAKK